MYEYLSIYWKPGFIGVFLGHYEGKDMRAEMPIPNNSPVWYPSSEELLKLVDLAIRSWHQ